MTCFLITPYYSDLQYRVDNMSRLHCKTCILLMSTWDVMMSENKPGKLAEQIICWISIALCHGDLPCCTQSLPADAEREILFFWPDGNVVFITVCKEGTTLD